MSKQQAGPRARATWIGIAAIGLWSCLALLTLTTRELPAFQVLAITFAMGGASIMFWPSGQSRWQQPLPAFLLTIVALFGYHALYFFAFRMAPAVEVNLINYLWPLLIVVFAALLPDTQINRWQILGAMMGLAGAMLMIARSGTSGSAVHWHGYATAFAAALVWALYSVLNRRFQSVPSSTVGVCCLVVAVLAGLVHAGFESWVMPSSRQWLMLVLMGLGPMGMAFLLWDHGTKHGDLGVLGTLAYAAPVLSTLLLLASGQAEVHWTQAAAVVLLLIGAWLSVGLGREKASPVEQ